MTFKKIMIYEIKEQVKSKIFYAFIVVLLIMNLVDYSNGNNRLNPLETDVYYGYIASNVDEDVLYRGYELLSMAYLDKQVIRYIPLGTYKDLSSIQLEELGEFLKKMAPSKDIPLATKDDFEVDLSTMFEYMDKFDKEVGGKTYFANKEDFYTKKMSYEEANEERLKIKEQDNFTRSYARLYSDYNGIYAAMFLVFLVAFSIYRDTRTGQRELHYTSNTKSFSYIGGKFLGLLISIMSVFLLFALFETAIFLVEAFKYKESIDTLAFIWTTLIWITPTVMFCISFPLVIYILSDNFLLTILLQLIISFYMITSTDLSGDYGLTRLIIRFNRLAPYETFQPFASSILINRFFYTLVSLAILAIATYAWDLKKKKMLYIEKINA